MSNTQSDPYGLTPVPRDPSLLSPSRSNDPPVLDSAELKALFSSSSEVCKQAEEHLKGLLGEKLLNHSKRAYLFGASSFSDFLPLLPPRSRND
jgi:hypothetical protein